MRSNMLQGSTLPVLRHGAPASRLVRSLLTLATVAGFAGVVGLTALAGAATAENEGGRLGPDQSAARPASSCSNAFNDFVHLQLFGSLPDPHDPTARLLTLDQAWHGAGTYTGTRPGDRGGLAWRLDVLLETGPLDPTEPGDQSTPWLRPEPSPILRGVIAIATSDLGRVTFHGVVGSSPADGDRVTDQWPDTALLYVVPVIEVEPGLIAPWTGAGGSRFDNGSARSNDPDGDRACNDAREARRESMSCHAACHVEQLDRMREAQRAFARCLRAAYSVRLRCVLGCLLAAPPAVSLPCLVACLAYAADALRNCEDAYRDALEAARDAAADCRQQCAEAGWPYRPDDLSSGGGPDDPFR